MQLFWKEEWEKRVSTYFPFFICWYRQKGTPDLFIAVKEGEEDTTYYSQRLIFKSALSTDICTCTYRFKLLSSTEIFERLMIVCFAVEK